MGRQAPHGAQMHHFLSPGRALRLPQGSPLTGRWRALSQNKAGREKAHHHSMALVLSETVSSVTKEGTRQMSQRPLNLSELRDLDIMSTP